MEALLEVHGREVRRVVRGQVDSDADADDAEQEVRVKLLRAASEGRRLNRVRILVWAKNVVKDIWRKRSSDRRKGKAVALEPDLLMYVPQGPEAEARNRRIEDLVAAALQSVPKAQREAYVAREVLGCTYKEAAEELGKSPPTLRQLVYLARKRIRSWLVERGVSSSWDV